MSSFHYYSNERQMLKTPLSLARKDVLRGEAMRKDPKSF